MSDPDWRDEIGQRVRIPQIIVAAMLVGCGAFLAIAMFINAMQTAPVDKETSALITFVGVIVTFAVIGARMVIPAVIVASTRQAILQGTPLPRSSAPRDAQAEEFLARTGDAGRLWLAFLTRTILGAAMLEGCAFFNLIAYLVEGTPLSLGIAIGLMAALACHFPTRSGVVHWIEDQLNQVAQQNRH